MGGKQIPVPFDGRAAGALPYPGEGRVDVFIADARAAPGDTAVLGAVERSRAASFVRGADRSRYEAAHVMLRLLLSSYLGTGPQALGFYRESCPLCGGPHGRPAVKSDPRLHFSLSHGGGYALAAFAAAPVGVDVEPVPDFAVMGDLLGCLDGAEGADLAALARAERPEAFARAWVRKEARLKALGTGLALDPATVHVGIGPVPGAGTVDLVVPDGSAGALHLLE
ncbi:4'-phosphopantetheinyl transferase family protein [Glycomyces buryatensis]|uniref:4'-phosphopantetheinyl transferase superfamily protein n=1 Tax=Glycomyces buryatensis TaxID=2570927 RepID=A0A4V4HQD8_9ACTN|nr:4'-phosphopantetheinyl transferase superfamily protein [Glycomyces buryatensis]THV33446.1 4'-phosphopantetheinyl transferase superfamily protein [Glycomyces buryatensis]